MEKSYEELSERAKRGINKYTRLSLKEMKHISNAFRKETGKNPNNVELKEDFFKFVNSYNQGVKI